MSERSVGPEQVRLEQEAAVDPRWQWAYLAVVLIGGFVAMLLLIALLGAVG